MSDFVMKGRVAVTEEEIWIRQPDLDDEDGRAAKILDHEGAYVGLSWERLSQRGGLIDFLNRADVAALPTAHGATIFNVESTYGYKCRALTLTIEDDWVGATEQGDYIVLESHEIAAWSIRA